ncbi:MAG: hypothetical protein WCY00_02350 [Candidatus Dojkabacteria bacterium]|jgi:heme/copper-type cytochrome/quinol oxidase subunit 3
MKKKYKKFLIVVFPIIFGLFMYWLRSNYIDTYDTVGKEDHIVEWMQFFLFLTSAILATTIAIKTGKISKLLRVIFVILALGLFFVAFEEISWGERVFNIEAPEVFDDGTLPLLGENVQSEMNLHNFRTLHNLVGKAYIIIATYAIFSSFIASLFYKIKKDVKEKTKFLISFITPPTYLILYFAPLYINLLNRKTFGIKPQDYEMVEFLFALGITIFLCVCLKKIDLHLKNEGKGKR